MEKMKIKLFRSRDRGKVNKCGIMHVCVVCNRKIDKGTNAARKIDGLWMCSFGCIDKFLKVKKTWTSEN